MGHLHGPVIGGVIHVDQRVKFTKQLILPGVFTHQYFYVDGNNGSDNNNGETLSNAKASIQAAVNLANAPKYATKNVDIFVGNGNYEETVEITRAGTGLDYTAMLWENMGSNCGKIGTLRIVGPGGWLGTGYAKWTTGAAATQPGLYVGRPNVEVHNFNMQLDSDGTLTKATWGDGDEMAGHAHVGMPFICVEDQFNNDALLNGAGNNFLLNNCRVNGGGKANGGGLLNSGAKWVNVINCIFEYCAGYGIAHIGNSKGTASESHTRGVLFSQNTYDFAHGAAICLWINDCHFATASTKQLLGISPCAGATHSTIRDCTVMNQNGLEHALNSGWDAYNILDYTEGWPQSSGDLSSDNWVPAAST